MTRCACETLDESKTATMYPIKVKHLTNTELQRSLYQNGFPVLARNIKKCSCIPYCQLHDLRPKRAWIAFVELQRRNQNVGTMQRPAVPRRNTMKFFNCGFSISPDGGLQPHTQGPLSTRASTKQPGRALVRVSQSLTEITCNASNNHVLPNIRRVHEENGVHRGLCTKGSEIHPAHVQRPLAAVTHVPALEICRGILASSGWLGPRTLCASSGERPVEQTLERNNSNALGFLDTVGGEGGRYPGTCTVLRVEGDGRCLFRSLVTAMSPSLQAVCRDDYGRPCRAEEANEETLKADELRARVVSLMQDNLHFYSELERGVINADQPTDLNYQLFRDRLAAMARPSTMPGDLELNAVAMVLERQILVLNTDFQAITIYGQERFPQSPILAVRYTRLVADVGHYDAVILSPEVTNVHSWHPKPFGKEGKVLGEACTELSRLTLQDGAMQESEGEITTLDRQPPDNGTIGSGLADLPASLACASRRVHVPSPCCRMCRADPYDWTGTQTSCLANARHLFRGDRGEHWTIDRNGRCGCLSRLRSLPGHKVNHTTKAPHGDSGRVRSSSVVGSHCCCCGDRGEGVVKSLKFPSDQRPRCAHVRGCEGECSHGVAHTDSSGKGDHTVPLQMPARSSKDLTASSRSADQGHRRRQQLQQRDLPSPSRARRVRKSSADETEECWYKSTSLIHNNAGRKRKARDKNENRKLGLKKRRLDRLASVGTSQSLQLRSRKRASHGNFKKMNLKVGPYRKNIRVTNVCDVESRESSVNLKARSGREGIHNKLNNKSTIRSNAINAIARDCKSMSLRFVFAQAQCLMCRKRVVSSCHSWLKCYLCHRVAHMTCVVQQWPCWATSKEDSGDAYFLCHVCVPL